MAEPALPITLPVREVVLSALRELPSRDRDEAYLLARLEAGEGLREILDEQEENWPNEGRDNPS